MAGRVGSVLFACDLNAIRSPMAEGLTKQMYGVGVYAQSCGVRPAELIDGFAVAVAAEVGVQLAAHRPRSFAELENARDDIDSFDLIVALSPAAQRRALDYTHDYALDVEYWPTLDPSGLGEQREDKLAAYRQCRDQLIERIRERFRR